MDLVHTTAYINPQSFEAMEQLRKSRRSRTTRSQWIDEAVAEKIERDTKQLPAQHPAKKRAS